MNQRLVRLQAEIHELYASISEYYKQKLDTYKKLHIHEKSYSKDEDGFMLGLVIGDAIASANTRPVIALLGRYDTCAIAACAVGSIADGINASRLYSEFPASWRKEEMTSATQMLALRSIMEAVGIGNLYEAAIK